MPGPTTAKGIAGAAGAAAFGPLGALAGPIIGGLFGRSGQDSANQANLRIARENREFQERMSNTAHQRSAADLSKAGLNRILALGQPATTPAGNIATMQNKNALLAQGINQGVTSGLTAKRLNAEITNINARTNLTDAQRRALGGISEMGGGIGDVLSKGRSAVENLFGDWKGTGATINTIGSKISTSAKEALRKLPKISVALGDTRRSHNSIALQAAEQYALDHPNASESQIRAEYKRAFEKSKRNRK